MGMKRERAFALVMQRNARSVIPAIVADGQADEVITVMPYMSPWEAGVEYGTGDTVQWQVEGREQPMTCREAHSTAVHPDWTPDTYPAGWHAWHATSPENALPYLMRHAEDRYMAGECMTWGDEAHPERVYRCLADDVVHSPLERAGAWTMWPADGAEAGGGDDMEGGAYPVWAAWDGENVRLYQIGDRVVYEGAVWESTAANNHWAPGVYGWELVEG